MTLRSCRNYSQSSGRFIEQLCSSSKHTVSQIAVTHCTYCCCLVATQAYKGHVAALVMLIKMTHQGVNTRDAYGQAPLHLAALRGNLDAVEYLVLEAKVSLELLYFTDAQHESMAYTSAQGRPVVQCM
jgi:hypothetical protein